MREQDIAANLRIALAFRLTGTVRKEARKIGISSATLSRVTRGVPCDLKTFAIICSAYNLDANVVLGLNKRLTIITSDSAL